MTLGRSFFLIATLATACGRAPATTSAAPPVAAASAAPMANAQASAGSDAGQPGAHWRGKYTSGPGSFFVPDASEWSGVKWRGDDGGAGVGEGTLELEVAPTSGLVEGTASGALGEALVTGTQTGDTITATVRRRDPSDRGFTGTLFATRRLAAVDGTMRLSPGDAHVIREATFTLTEVAR